MFPHMVSQLFVGPRALDQRARRRDGARQGHFLAAQKNAKTNEPTPDDIFGVGTLGTVMQLLRLPDGTVKVLVEGKRAREGRSASRRPTSTSSSRSKRSPRAGREGRRGRGA